MGCLGFMEAWEAACVGSGVFQAKAMSWVKAWDKIPGGPQAVVATGVVVGECELRWKSGTGLFLSRPECYRKEFKWSPEGHEELLQKLSRNVT